MKRALSVIDELEEDDELIWMRNLDLKGFSTLHELVKDEDEELSDLAVRLIGKIYRN